MHDGNTTVESFSMGAAAPEDFSSAFGFPLDLIKVTRGQPLFSRDEARGVIVNAEAEGVDKNEYKSGKYRLGGKEPARRNGDNGRKEKRSSKTAKTATMRRFRSVLTRRCTFVHLCRQ